MGMYGSGEAFRIDPFRGLRKASGLLLFVDLASISDGVLGFCYQLFTLYGLLEAVLAMAFWGSENADYIVYSQI